MGFGMLFAFPVMVLAALAVVAGPVLGLLWLARGGSLTTAQPLAPAAGSAASVASCPECHRGVQADWQNCPYCGHKLC
jgi:hypothetical protein